MGVWLYAILDVAKMLKQTTAYRTWLCAEVVTFAGLDVVDIRNRRNHGCCAAGTGFLKRVKLFLWNLTAFQLQAEVFGKLHRCCS